MIRIIALTLTFGSLFSSLHSQILTFDHEKSFEDHVTFDSAFIKMNKVQKVVGKISHKPSLEPIWQTGLIVQYDFNKDGQLTHQTTTFRKRGGVIDTNNISYQYNDIHQLISVGSDYGQGFSAYEYKYENGHVVKQQYSRGENASYAMYSLERGKEFIISTEAYSYDTIDANTIKKQYLNGQGKAYQETIIQYDTLGNISMEDTRFILTNKRNTINYIYNDYGRIQKIIDFNNFMDRTETEYLFTYDKHGNIQEEKVLENGKLVTTKQFLYLEESLLLNAKLIKNEATGLIVIIQYEYTFY